MKNLKISVVDIGRNFLKCFTPDLFFTSFILTYGSLVKM